MGVGVKPMKSWTILILFLFSLFPFSLKADSPKILINEVLPSPTGSDLTDEWIEIFNPNNFEFNLSGWKIQDTIGKIKTYIFPKGTKILAKGFLVLKRPESKITLNNDGDGLKLIDPEGKTIDEISYQKAQKGKSYNRGENGWFWNENLTPSAENVKPIIKETQKSITEISEKELAAVGEGISKENLSPFLIALIIAIFSGTIILILKRKIDKVSKID
jgi:hypothetical protein